MIARLRTAAGNVPLFEQAGAAPGVPTGSLKRGDVYFEMFNGGQKTARKARKVLSGGA